MDIGAFYPQYHQFFFARAFGARGALGIRSLGERAKNKPFVRKRSWRILSVRDALKLSLCTGENVKTLTSTCSAKTPQLSKFYPAPQWRASFVHMSKH